MGNKVEAYFEEKLKGMPKEEVVIQSVKKLKAPKQNKPIAFNPVSSAVTQATPIQSPTVSVQGDVQKQRRSSTRPIRPPVKDIPLDINSLSSTVIGKNKKKSKQKMSPRMKYCHTIIRELMHKKHMQYAWPFYKPVDVVLLQLHDYHQIIKKPMDLGTAKKKLEQGQYMEANEFLDDIELIFRNCYKYNPAEHDIVAKCKELHHQFQLLKNKLPEKERTPSPEPVIEEPKKEKKTKERKETAKGPRGGIVFG